MDINTLLFKPKGAKVKEKGPGCWECPHLDKKGSSAGVAFCLKHNATIHDRDRKKEYCVVQCDEPQVIKIERKSW